MAVALEAILVAGLAAGVCLHGTSYAGEAVDLAKQAESYATDGKHAEAYEAMRSATLQVWDEGPLLFRKALFAAEAPKAFGIYKPRADHVFKPGEKLIIYAEPVGFKWLAKDGLNHSLLVADLILRTNDGKIVAGQKNFGTFSFDSLEQNMEIMVVMTVDFTGAPPGQYVVECAFTDKMSGKTANLELPFELK
jgi:hypothetical protein